MATFPVKERRTDAGEPASVCVRGLQWNARSDCLNQIGVLSTKAKDVTSRGLLTL